MKNGLQFSFREDSVGGDFYSILYEKYISFVPYSFNLGYKGVPWNGAKHIGVISTSGRGQELAYFDRQRNVFSSGRTGASSPSQSVCIEQDASIFNPSDADILELICYSDSFISCYLYNVEYTYVQSTSAESNFEGRNIPQDILDTLKNTPFKVGVFGGKRYDVRFNPGGQVLIGYTWLMSAWKMWFGGDFFKIVPKERLLSFPHAVEIKELERGHIFVHLFDKIEESHTPDSVFRQWKWQEWLDFDRLAERYP